MTNQELNNILNDVFFDFENNLFINEGCWPRKVNLIFAFADYIDTLSDEDIAEKLNSTDAFLIDKFRKTATKGIDLWLKENMKTLML